MSVFQRLLSWSRQDKKGVRWSHTTMWGEVCKVLNGKKDELDCWQSFSKKVYYYYDYFFGALPADARRTAEETVYCLQHFWRIRYHHLPIFALFFVKRALGQFWRPQFLSVFKRSLGKCVEMSVWLEQHAVCRSFREHTKRPNKPFSWRKRRIYPCPST